MNFDITEDQRRTQQAAREFAERVLAPVAADVDKKGQLDREALQKLSEAGWLGMTIPEAQGGSGGDFTALALAVEELAVGCANTAAFVAANTAVARALLAYGNEAQKSGLLPNVARGKTSVACVVFNPDELVSVRRQNDGSFELHGKTEALTIFGKPEQGFGAQGAVGDPKPQMFNQVLVWGRDAATSQIQAFLVPMGAASLNAEVVHDSLGKRAASLATLFFEGTRVSESALLGGAGDEAGATTLETERILAAAVAIGTARAAYESAVQHLKAQPKSTEPGLQGVQVLIADMSVELDAARLLVLRAAGQIDAGGAAGSNAAMAKLFATEMATRAAHKALQIHGARHAATMRSLDRHFRDARMGELADDGLAAQRASISQTMLKA